MRLLPFLSLWPLFVLAILARDLPGRRPLVDLGYSKYQGVRLATGVDQFLGMRFAAPPLDHLRFRAPRDPIQHSAVQDASEFGPVCIGVDQNVTTSQAEDCLFINVFTPSGSNRTSKLPVWVYIQGGGYTSNANANYNGTGVVQESARNIILVNFNYRVGALGFLSGDVLRHDGDHNVGLLDQRKALQWVQRHIRNFGGDPEHVVIHGASAGAGSVAFHLTANGGRDEGLFVGAIAQAPSFTVQRTIGESNVYLDRLLDRVGCTTISCLRSRAASAIQASVFAPTGSPAAATYIASLVWVPVIDGRLVQRRLYAAFEEGRFVRVPLMVGGVTDEGSAFAYNASSREDVTEFTQGIFPTLRSTDLWAINKAYPRLPPVPRHGAYFPTASAILTDAAFTCPGLHMTRSKARRGCRDSWNYRYNVQDPFSQAMGWGVPHTVETTAIFGLDYGGGIGFPSMADTNAPIIPIVMNYFISFVRELDPNTLRHGTAPFWQPWGAARQRLKIETNDTVMERVPSVQQARCALFKRLAPITKQ
ncbi:carboxylesterase estA [Aspergillus carlsbadensis]|nr:carboxylesterase estA [Aspergillus carlsbadensis]